MYEKTGEVVSVNPTKCAARVKFNDQDEMISAELQIVVRGSAKNKDYWIPKVGEEVYCSFTEQKKGYILGTVYSEIDAPSVTDANVRQIEFEDGTIIEYNSADHTLSINSAGAVNIIAKGNVNVTGDVIADGVSLKNHMHTAPGGNTSPPNGGA